MLKPNQFTEVSWHNQTREWYESKGYVFTRYKDKFLVKCEDLSVGNHQKVVVICDYCGEEFITPFVQHIKSSENHGDCCRDCTAKKIKDVFIEKYGVNNVFQSDYAKSKSIETCQLKYGVDRACQSEEVKQKIAKTNEERYGNKCPLLNEEVHKKAEETMMEKFGVANIFLSDDFQKSTRDNIAENFGVNNVAQIPYVREKIKETNMNKFGVVWSTQSKEVQAKMRESLYKNGSIPTSQQEAYICEMLKDIYGEENCVAGFPLDTINFDCLLKIKDNLIDVEYDGWYWHKNRQEQDKRRNYFVMSQGYKVLRIRSNNTLPTEEQIKEAVDYLVNNHHLAYIDLDI